MASAPSLTSAPEDQEGGSKELQDTNSWAPGLDDQDRAILKAINADPKRIVEWALTPVKRLGYLDTGFIILNRCIGTYLETSLTIVS
jgi:hypothetical protein